MMPKCISLPSNNSLVVDKISRSSGFFFFNIMSIFCQNFKKQQILDNVIELCTQLNNSRNIYNNIESLS